MKDIEKTLAKTEKGSPLYMAPEVSHGMKYSGKADVWSLCATFYKIYKGKGPYFDKSVRSSFALAQRKQDPKNYLPLSQNDCPHQPIRDLINYNLMAKPLDRMNAEQALTTLGLETPKVAKFSVISEKNTEFGNSSMQERANFFDKTYETVEMSNRLLGNPQKLVVPQGKVRINESIEDSYYQNSQLKITPGMASSDYVSNPQTGLLVSKRPNLMEDTVLAESIETSQFVHQRPQDHYNHREIEYQKQLEISDTVDYNGVDKKYSEYVTNQSKKPTYFDSIQKQSNANDCHVNPRTNAYKFDREDEMVSIEDEEDEIPEDFEFHNEDRDKKKAELIDKEYRVFQSFREKDQVNSKPDKYQTDVADESDKFMFESLYKGPGPMRKKKQPEKAVISKNAKNLKLEKQENELMSSFLSKTGERESRVDFEYTKTMTQTREKKADQKIAQPTKNNFMQSQTNHPQIAKLERKESYENDWEEVDNYLKNKPSFDSDDQNEAREVDYANTIFGVTIEDQRKAAAEMNKVYKKEEDQYDDWGYDDEEFEDFEKTKKSKGDQDDEDFDFF